jgi:4'-phosphopantetheinyl transferase
LVWNGIFLDFYLARELNLYCAIHQGQSLVASQYCRESFMVRVYAVNIRDIVVNPEWLRFVSDHKHQRLYGIRDPKSLVQNLTGDLLVRFLAIQYLGVSNQHLLFQTTEFGKPYLVTSTRPFHFNLSHSGHWVICAVDQSPVGIDVQLMEPIDLNLVKSVLAPKDYRHYLNLPPQQRLDYFYDLWTMSESLLKLSGQGLSDVPVVMQIDQLKKQSAYYQRYELEPEYRLAACTLSNHFEPSLFHVNLISIVQELYKSHQI